MFLIYDGLKSFFLLSIGAILGSWMRLHLTNIFCSIFSRRYWGTLFVNITASFLLGFLWALKSEIGNHSLSQTSPFFVFICVGFLGSLSTFSTFICELLDCLTQKHWKQFLSISLYSIVGGVLASLLGLILGNA